MSAARYYAWVRQDNWKVTNRLTLNIGLRYEVQLPYLERYNRMGSEFNINQVNPLSPQILAPGMRTRRRTMPPIRNTRIRRRPPPSRECGDLPV